MSPRDSIFSLASVIILLIAGCRPTTQSQSADDRKGNVVKSSGSPTGVSITTNTYDAGSGAYSASKTIEQATQSQLAEAWNALDWETATSRPRVALVRWEDGDALAYFTVKRDRDSPQGEIRADWQLFEGELERGLISPVLDSPEQALALLIAFHQDGSDLSKLTVWQDENEKQ